MNDKVLLYSTENYVCSPVMNYSGHVIKECIYIIYVCIYN